MVSYADEEMFNEKRNINCLGCKFGDLKSDNDGDFLYMYIVEKNKKTKHVI